MIKKEFLKPNKDKVKIFLLILIIAIICLFVAKSALEKLFQLDSLSGLPLETEVYEIIACILSVVLFWPASFIMGKLYSLRVLPIILALFFNIGYWYYISCAIYSLKEKIKKSLYSKSHVM